MASLRICPICNIEFNGKGRAVYCSASCKKVAKDRRKDLEYEDQRARVLECKIKRKDGVEIDHKWLVRGKVSDTTRASNICN